MPIDAKWRGGSSGYSNEQICFSVNLCVLCGESTWPKGRYSGPDPLTDKTIGNPVTERDTRAARGNLIAVYGI